MCFVTKMNVDFTDVVKTYTEVNKDVTTTGVCVAVSAAVTAYARIYMNKIKLDILKRGGYIYYQCLCSIVTNVPLPSQYVGDRLGQFKLEHTAIKGIFITNKTYLIKDSMGGVVSKIKGVNTKPTEEQFEELLSGKSISILRRQSLRSLVEGYTKINLEKNITISPDSYTKRTKI